MKSKTLFLSILAIGFVVRLHGLGERSLWTDEFFTLFQSTGHGIDAERLVSKLRQPGSPVPMTAGELKHYLHRDDTKTAQDVLRSVLVTDDHPPLYFLSIHFWIKAFGDSAVAVRMFSVLMGLASIAAAYAVARRLFDERSGLATALFVSISPFSVRFSQEARAYSLVLCAGLVSMLVFLRLERDKKPVDILLLSLANACGLLSHYFFGFFILVEFCYATIFYRRDRSRLDAVYLSVLAGFLLAMPWVWRLIVQHYNFQQAAWILGFPGLTDKFVNLGAGCGRFIALINASKPFSTGLFLTASALVILVIGSRLGDCIRRHPRSCVLCLAMLLVPLTGMFILDITEHGVLLRQERFWMFMFVGAAPLFGYSLARLYERRKTVAVSFAVALLAASWNASGVQFGPAPKSASYWIKDAAKDRLAAVVVFNLRSVLLAQAYYLPDSMVLLPVSDDKQFREVQDAAGNRDTLFLVRHHHPSGPLLTDNDFMAAGIGNKGFCIKRSFDRFDVDVSEYTPCAS